MIISETRYFIFVHMLRTGGTSVETALAPHTTWRDLILGTTELGSAIDSPYWKTYRLNGHSSVEEIVAACGEAVFARSFTFATVRHPVDRLVSMYNLLAFLFERTGVEPDLLRQGVRDGRPDRRWPFLDWAVARGYSDGDGFGGFIRSKWTHGSRLLVPQVRQLQTADGRLQVDLPVRLDRIGEYLAVLEDRLGIAIDLPHVNRAQVVALTPAEVAGPDRQYIAEVFAADFEAYGFEVRSTASEDHGAP